MIVLLTFSNDKEEKGTLSTNCRDLSCLKDALENNEGMKCLTSTFTNIHPLTSSNVALFGDCLLKGSFLGLVVKTGIETIEGQLGSRVPDPSSYDIKGENGKGLTLSRARHLFQLYCQLCSIHIFSKMN